MTNPADFTDYQPVIPVAGRSCEGCAMCCKLSSIDDVNTKAGEWCQHCSTRKCCDIYESRPNVCRAYYCYYMLSTLGEEWHPMTSKIMLTALPDLMIVSVDPARPDAWRKEPYFKNLQEWSKQMRVQVSIKQYTYAIYPDHIDDLGIVDEDHFVASIEEPSPFGMIRRAIKVHKKDLPAGTTEGTYKID